MTHQAKEIRDFIEGMTGPIPEKDWLLYEGNLVESFSPKGSTILEIGKPCTKIWHMLSGAVRKTEVVDGVSKTTHFYTAPKVFTVLESALNRSPSDLSIVCEEECNFLELPFERLSFLYDQSRFIERIGRRIVEHEFIEEFSIRRMFLKMDSLERYLFIEENHPDILKRFQLKDVATFLGITPETLSRLRKNRFSR